MQSKSTFLRSITAPISTESSLEIAAGSRCVVVVPVRVHRRAGRTGMKATVPNSCTGWTSGMIVVFCGTTICWLVHTLRGASEASFARRTRIVVLNTFCSDSSHLVVFRVDGVVVEVALGLWLSLPELPLATARGVVVCWRGAVLLLALVMACYPDLDQGADEEEETIVLVSFFVESDLEEFETYAPTSETAKQAVFRRHAKPSLGLYVTPSP